jgi:predicted DNA-binding ribbon-helix-helix protein
MKSTVTRRSVVIGGHKTSVSLEDAYWSGLKQIAHHQGVTTSNIVATIDPNRYHSNLSTAVRLFVLEEFSMIFPEKIERDKQPLAPSRSG